MTIIQNNPMPDRKDYPSSAKIWQLFRVILGADKSFYWIALIYGAAVSLLTLAIPISVQSLINSVANTMLPAPVITLAIVLLLVLLLSVVLYAMQYYILELFEQRFYARITSEITLRSIFAQNSYYDTINRDALTNRYFDIMTVQKCVPQLIVGGGALLLQALVGFVLVSFYHPALLAFNIIFIICVMLIWLGWKRKAMRGAFQVSDCKYDTARWLEELARSNYLFKSERNTEYAINRSEQLIQAYVKSRKHYFRTYFSQTIGFLLLYAVASASLLGLGGILVLSEQLTLGQLVAAELVLSAIFYGMSRFGYYLQLYYELCAAIHKLNYFYKIPLESREGLKSLSKNPFSLEFKQVCYHYRNHDVRLNIKLEPKQKYWISPASTTLERLFIDLLKNYRQPESGMVMLGNEATVDYDIGTIRDRIFALHNTLVLEGSILDYLKFGAPAISQVEIENALKLVELDQIIQKLPEKLQAQMTPTGYPLTTSEILRLKLARAILLKPNVIILTHLFDSIALGKRQRIIKGLLQNKELTLIYFSRQRDIEGFDRYTYLDWQNHHTFKSLDELIQHEFTAENAETPHA